MEKVLLFVQQSILRLKASMTRLGERWDTDYIVQTAASRDKIGEYVLLLLEEEIYNNFH